MVRMSCSAKNGRMPFSKRDVSLRTAEARLLLLMESRYCFAMAARELVCFCEPVCATFNRTSW